MLKIMHCHMLLILSMLISVHLSAQDTKNSPQQTKKSFDIARFNANQTRSSWWFTQNEHTIVQRKWNDTNDDNRIQYIEELYYDGDNDTYILYSAYNRQGILLHEGHKLYDMQVGIWKKYNSQGALIATTDYDTLVRGYPSYYPLRDDYDIDQGRFEFSIKDLAEIMRQKFKINIFDGESIVHVARLQVPDPFYVVYALDSPGIIKVEPIRKDPRYYVYLIGGKTGEILYHAWWYPTIPPEDNERVGEWRVDFVVESGVYEQYYREKYHQEPTIRWPYKPPPPASPRILTEEEKKIEERNKIIRQLPL